MASDVADIRDLDELEVYGSEAQTSVQIASYVFEVWSVCVFPTFVWHVFNKSRPEKRKEKCAPVSWKTFFYNDEVVGLTFQNGHHFFLVTVEYKVLFWTKLSTS